MPTFSITVTETYVNTFSLEAESAEEAQALAEEMATERSFPSDHSESCERSIEASPEA